MRSEGYTIAGEPRTSGDGYFESVVSILTETGLSAYIGKQQTNRKNKARQETDIENIPRDAPYRTFISPPPFEERDGNIFSLAARTESGKQCWMAAPSHIG